MKYLIILLLFIGGCGGGGYPYQGVGSECSDSLGGSYYGVGHGAGSGCSGY